MACLSLTLLATIATYFLLSCAHGRFEPLSTSGVKQAAWEVEQTDSGKDFLNADAAIQKLQKETERLGSRIHELEDTLKHQESRSQRQLQESYIQMTQEMDKKLTNLERMLSRNMSNSDPLAPGNNIQSVINIPVAFSTLMSSKEYNTGINVPLVFDVVLTNEGSGYDKSTGAFTAPISGVYVFTYFLGNSQIESNAQFYKGLLFSTPEQHAQVGPWVTRHTTVTLSVNYKMKTFASSKDTNPGGNVVVLLVNKGDEVRLQGRNEASVSNNEDWGYSSFSGFLLFVI